MDDGAPAWGRAASCLPGRVQPPVRCCCYGIACFLPVPVAQKLYGHRASRSTLRQYSACIPRGWPRCRWWAWPGVINAARCHPPMGGLKKVKQTRHTIYSCNKRHVNEAEKYNGCVMQQKVPEASDAGAVPALLDTLMQTATPCVPSAAASETELCLRGTITRRGCFRNILLLVYVDLACIG